MLLQRCKRRTTGVKPFYMIIDLLLVRGTDGAATDGTLLSHQAHAEGV